ncbi:hypothetical protein BH09VER1_BH09VER1_05260 [soil metagenome]
MAVCTYARAEPSFRFLPVEICASLLYAPISDIFGCHKLRCLAGNGRYPERVKNLLFGLLVAWLTSFSDAYGHATPAPDPAMVELGTRAASGDLAAIDELAVKYQELYAGIDYQNDRERLLSNYDKMRAAFDVIGLAAGQNTAAWKALQYAAKKAEINSFVIGAYGLAAEAGNDDALKSLLNYKDNGWLLSTTVLAMRAPAKKDIPDAVNFLIAIMKDPTQRALHAASAEGLKEAADSGNTEAQELISAYRSSRGK